MRATSPYRTAVLVDEGLAPDVGWTGHARTFVAVASALVPVAACVHLLFDRDCDGAPHVNLGAAMLVVLVTASLTGIGVVVQQRLVHWIVTSVRTRSIAMARALAAATLLPSIVLATLAAFVSVWLDVAFTFRLCLDLTPIFAWGC